MNGAAYSEGYTYNSEDGSLNTMTTGVGDTLTMGYDGLRRLTSVTGGPVSRQYTYRDVDSVKTTMQVASVTSGGQRYGYTYDSMGNIATFSAPGKGTVTYTYDNQGQLLKAAGDTTYTYTYDGAGNLLTASNGTATHSYTYGDASWKDLLTAFDGQTITYDAIGNPTSYCNGTRWAMTWENGRSLATASDGTNSLSFAYDANGLRTSKTVNGTTYRYYYAGGKLMRMTWGTNTIDFFYDASGLPYAMKYNGTAYYYITNLQGDVMRIVDASQNIVTSYDYDPYGKVISTTGTLANINPLRYRGYVYDWETGFYYLQSRYYDPTIGRFLNVDGYVSTGQGIIGHNMFAYCGNNPVINEDKTGQFFLNAAIQLLKRWLNGDGTTQYYGEKTAPVKALKRSEKMRGKVNEAILNYQNDSSNYYVRDTVEFTRDDGWNSYLAFGAVSYIITVRTETRTRGVWFWKHEQTRYVAEVMVSDLYNFDSKPWSGLGNILNNGAAILHCFGVGKDYYWEANYSYATKWERSS